MATAYTGDRQDPVPLVRASDGPGWAARGSRAETGGKEGEVLADEKDRERRAGE